MRRRRVVRKNLKFVNPPVHLRDSHLRKPFKSNTLIDQQSLSRQTMPVAMAECYARCDRPPDLDSLNVFRTDGRSGLQFYTNPNYFFDLWRESILRETEREHHMKHQQHPKVKHATQNVAQQQKDTLNHQLEKEKKRQRAQRDQFVNNVIRFPEEYQAPADLRQKQRVGTFLVIFPSIFAESNAHPAGHGAAGPVGHGTEQ